MDKRNFSGSNSPKPNESPTDFSSGLAGTALTQMGYDHIFKVVLVGDQGVGKSNLLRRATKDQFDPDSQVTLGIEFASKIVRVPDEGRAAQFVKAQIWDTAGQEKFRSITGAYYRNAVGALLVYDITSRSSFEGVKHWVRALRENADPGIVMILIGNKCDLKDQRQVRQEEALQFSEKNRKFTSE